MKKKALFVFWALVMALVVVGCSSSPSQDQETRKIKIGASLPLSGPLANFGEGAKFGFQAAIDDINEAGGVYVKEYDAKLPVELVVLDNESDPAKASSNASDLILRHSVDALVGNGTPVVDIPISSVADRNKTTFLAATPFEPWWDTGPYEYAWNQFFRVATPLPADDPRANESGFKLTDLLLDVTKKFEDQTNKKVAIFVSDDADGRAWYSIFPEVVKAAGYEPPVGYDKKLGLFPPGTIDFTPIIREWKSAGAEILWINTPPPDTAVLLRQMESVGYKPKLVISFRALIFQQDVEAVGGDLANGVFAEEWWYPDFPADQFPGIGDTTGQSLAQRYEATGKPLNMGIGVGYSQVQVILDAVERAGTLDKEAINTAIGETNMKTIYGDVLFTDTHDSPMRAVLGQWVKSGDKWEYRLVNHPLPGLKLSEPVFPKP